GCRSILGDERRQCSVVEGRRTSEQLHRARRRAKVRMGSLHPEAGRALGAPAEDSRERPRLGLVVGRNSVAMQAHNVGRVTRFVDRPLDHPAEPPRQARRLLLAREATLAGARGEADDLAVDPGATSPGALRLLEDEEAAPLTGHQPGVTAVVRGDEARAIIGREKQLLELSVGAATEGHIQVAVADETVRVPDGAGAADGPL